MTISPHFQLLRNKTLINTGEKPQTLISSLVQNTLEMTVRVFFFFFLSYKYKERKSKDINR